MREKNFERVELMEYAKKDDIFGAPVLEKLKKLELKEQIRIIAKEIMRREINGEAYPPPPIEVVAYIRRQGSSWEDFGD
jgi:hypothetical protein